MLHRIGVRWSVLRFHGATSIMTGMVGNGDFGLPRGRMGLVEPEIYFVYYTQYRPAGTNETGLRLESCQYAEILAEEAID